MKKPVKKIIYEPKVLWDCGNAKHRHLKKVHAMSCMDRKFARARGKERRAERKQRDQILRKQQVELEFKRFQKKCITDLAATGNRQAVENLKEFFNVSPT